MFLQFRLWLREGPVVERVLAGLASAIVAVLLVMASLPLTDHAAADGVTANAGPQADASASPTTSALPPTAGTSGQGNASVPAAGSAQVGAAAGAGTAANGVTVRSTTADACAARAASAPGISAKDVLVDISIVNLAGAVGNSAFNIRPDLHAVADAVVDQINKTGGLACGRQLVIKKYDVNPIDPNDQQSKCLQMVQDHPFVVIDVAGYITPVSRACFVQNKVPFQSATSAATNELRSSYPFIYGQTAPSEKQVRDSALGLAELGFVAGPRFQKLGLLEDSCEPEVNAELEASLAKVGVRPQQISKFTLSCQLIAPPSEILQAVLQHKGAGVSHVFLASSISNSQRYTQLAAQQDLRPIYGTGDYGTNTSSTGSWDPSFVGALAISSQHSGDLNSGIRSPEVSACDRILQDHGLKGISDERNDGTATGMCDVFKFFQQAIDKVGPNPTRLSFIEQGVSRMGIWKAGQGSDGIFNRPGKVVGGDFHRALLFDGGCTCWKVHGDATFKPGF